MALVLGPWMTRQAEAHGPPSGDVSSQLSIVVVELSQDSPELDEGALRAAIGRELGVIAVSPSDPRSTDRIGTLRVAVSRARDELVVEYVQGSRSIGRKLPVPLQRDFLMKSAVYLAGNLARDEANEIAASLRTTTQRREEPVSAKSPTSTPRFWVGVSAELDAIEMPTDANSNVCVLPNGSVGGYRCTDTDGTDFVLDFAHPQNRGFYPVSGGWGVKNGRILLSADYAANDQWLVGARVGWTIERYPGTLLDSGPSLGHLHLEARATYVFGDRPLAADGVHPIVSFATGAAQFDGKENLRDPSQPLRYAWKTYGPFFASAGLGVRWSTTSRFAVIATPAKVTIAFPDETVVAWSPELGVQVGL
jgi:hypothetical protein